MATVAPEKLRSTDALRTYRYLRVGMVGAAVLLATSILIERAKVDCFQTSISAYYYTPVRAIFVGAMFVVGFALIVYKGRTWWEDTCLNFAGMLAPVVAVAPTMDVGDCWSVEPNPYPVQDGSPADWVVRNIDNNFYSLLIAGGIGLAVALAISLGARSRNRPPARSIVNGTTITLAITALALLFGWWLIENWDDFYTRVHGYSAVAMFVFLIGAVVGKALERRREGAMVWFPLYALCEQLKGIGAALISLTRVFDEHTVFVLEAYEIGFFALYWIAQTVDNWDEEVVGVARPQAVPGGG